MADPARRLPDNVPGDFFVDETCIDCDTCRWMAPETFGRAGEQSVVDAQPRTAAQRRRALEALVSCPTASIGTAEKHDLVPILERFPLEISGNVHHAGYHHEGSYGAASYFVRSDAGNVLVDSPRFTRPLVRQLERMGGVDRMLLTHKDDVADHAKFQGHFGCERVLHARDVTAGTRGVERRLEGDDPVDLGDGFLAIPTPGHTRGSVCFLYRDRYLFSGDHVAWSVRLGHVYAFRSACWYDWPTTITSMRRLAAYDFEWILPGHSRRCRFPKREMREQMQTCIAWMERRR